MGGEFVFQNEYTALHLHLADGVLYCDGVEDRLSGALFGGGGKSVPLLHIPGFSFTGAVTEITEGTDDRGGLSAAARTVSVHFQKDGRRVRLTMRTYDGNPFIRLDLALGGVFGHPIQASEAGEESGVDIRTKKPAKPIPDSLFGMPISDRHLKLRTVTLRDVTDANNILFSEENTTTYPRRPLSSRGQFFLADAYMSGEKLMLVKEAPCPVARMGECDYDLCITPGVSVRMAGLGADFSSAAEYTEDMPLYGVSFAVGQSEEALQRAWRDCYRLDMAHTLRGGIPSMSNTWGDRNRDTAVCEEFMLRESERAQMLGVDAVQIDDGWQKGMTANSGLGKGTLWGEGYYASDPEYWKPHPDKFPRGLLPVTEDMTERGMMPGLWFSPDLANDYAEWERDAETLLSHHRNYGIRFFKLDGIDLVTKRQETNLLRMIRRVSEESGRRVSFNFDITARRRWGYLCFREFGNLFVENRYTDTFSYYPHSTLRTVWMLSRYIPVARLQMELLNLRRCPEKYENDPLAPGLYRADFAYAAVMFSCPLYWMEVSHLSEEDARVLSAIAAVRAPIARELAQADVTPLGEEPDGVAFTGLRADLGDRGYLLLFRENSPQCSYDFSIPALAGKKLRRLAGEGTAEIQGNTVAFFADAPRSFGLFVYE